MGEDEAALIRAAAAGDDRAFEALYARHRALVTRRLSHLVGPSVGVDDLVQETFIRAHRALATFRGECSFSSWLLRIALRAAQTEWRRARRSIWRLFVGAEERTVPVDGAAERYPELVAVHQALAHVSPRLREAVVLFDLEGCSLAEIAAELDVPLHTIAARVRRGRRALRERLERMGYGEARLALCTGESS